MYKKTALQLLLMYGDGFDERIVKVAKSLLGDNLISIFYGGTAAVGDTLEGWSDFDVVFVVKEVRKKDRKKAGEIGEKLGGGDSFKIHFMTKKELADTGPVWKLLNRYHARWPFGDDLREEIEVPDHDEILENLKDINRDIRKRFLQKEQNFDFWSEEKRKEYLYLFLKRIVHPIYCTFYYLQEGEFRGSREDLKEGSDENIKHIIDTLQNWNEYEAEDWSKEKESILEVSRKVEKADL